MFDMMLTMRSQLNAAAIELTHCCEFKLRDKCCWCALGSTSGCGKYTSSCARKVPMANRYSRSMSWQSAAAVTNSSPAGCACLDLSSGQAHSQVSNEGVLSLTTSVTGHHTPPGLLQQVNIPTIEPKLLCRVSCGFFSGQHDAPTALLQQVTCSLTGEPMLPLAKRPTRPHVASTAATVASVASLKLLSRTKVVSSGGGMQWSCSRDVSVQTMLRRPEHSCRKVAWQQARVPGHKLKMVGKRYQQMTTAALSRWSRQHAPQNALTAPEADAVLSALQFVIGITSSCSLEST